jgi:hypothetical protein
LRNNSCVSTVIDYMRGSTLAKASGRILGIASSTLAPVVVA